MYYVRFTHDGDDYMAFGEHELSLPIYQEKLPQILVRKGELNWPSWTKFMPYDDFEVIEEGQIDAGEIESKLGFAMTREEFDYAEDEIRETHASRFE